MSDNYHSQFNTTESMLPTQRHVYVNSLPTQPGERLRATRLSDMMPRVIASDERDARRFLADQRRRSGVRLTAEEITRDLREILTHLMSHLNRYNEGSSALLKTPTHALDYAERVAAYAIQDYPREYENDPQVPGLWNALNLIHEIGYSSRLAEPGEENNGANLVITIEKIAIDALDGIYPGSNEAQI